MSGRIVFYSDPHGERQPLLRACGGALGHDEAWTTTLLAEAGEPRAIRLLDVRQVYGFACKPLLDALACLGGAEQKRGEALVPNLVLKVIGMGVRAEVDPHVAEGSGR